VPVDAGGDLIARRCVWCSVYDVYTRVISRHSARAGVEEWLGRTLDVYEPVQVRARALLLLLLVVVIVCARARACVCAVHVVARQ
jgi:hypothetical protein